jgi:hypothetical protein
MVRNRWASLLCSPKVLSGTGTASLHRLFHRPVRRKLRIIPDKSGPLIFLRSFGTVPFWRETGPLPLAHPWLIYSELMYSSDPRAHEAAEEIKREFLAE